MTSCDQSAGAKQDIPSLPHYLLVGEMNYDFYHNVQMSEPGLFFCALPETLAVVFFVLKRPELKRKKGKDTFFFPTAFVTM